MHPRLTTIEQRLAPLRKQLADHPLYTTLNDLDDVRGFMEHHVFAVWDFMSLLKALQRELTCTAVPWLPKANPVLTRFINEIVWGEESDVNELGEPKSHFVMYLEAMEQAGADTAAIRAFVDQLQGGASVAQALATVAAPPAVQAFVGFTFELIEGRSIHHVAAAFTFGREDLIPDLFLAIIREAERYDGAGQYGKLTYYLQRHIDVDGDEHGPLSLQLIEVLCGDDAQKWQAVEDTAVEALQKRLDLWTAIRQRLVN